MRACGQRSSAQGVDSESLQVDSLGLLHDGSWDLGLLSMNISCRYSYTLPSLG